MYSKVKLFFVGDYLDRLTSYHDKSRLGLLFNISFALLCMGIVTTIISLILGTYAVLVPALGNTILALITMVIISKINFQTAGIIYFSILYLLLFGNINFNHGTMHVGAPFWIMIFNILVMYILDRYWGIFYMVLSFVGFGYFIVFQYADTIKTSFSLSNTTFYSAVYETAFVLFLLWYIIDTILKASKTSDRLLRNQNSELKVQNELYNRE